MIRKIIAIILIAAFVAMDISWACLPESPEHATQADNLAAQAAFQSEMMTEQAARWQRSLFSDIGLVSSIFSIAKGLFEDDVPLRCLDSTLTAELGDALKGIDLSRVAFSGGVILVPYERDAKKYVIQIAQRSDLTGRKLAGYEWVISDRYAVKVMPESYGEPPAETAPAEAQPAEAQPAEMRRAEKHAAVSEPVTEVEARVIDVTKPAPTVCRRLTIRAVRETAVAVDRAGASGLFEIVESAVNNARAEFVSTANHLAALVAEQNGPREAIGPEGLGKTSATAEIVHRVRKAIAAVEALDRSTLPAGAPEAAGKLKNGIERIEADSIVGSAIVLARRAKADNEKLIIGLETDWIPGINVTGYGTQHDAINPIMQEIRSLPEALRSMGLDNVILIMDKAGDELKDAILTEAQKTHTKLSNVVVLASNATIQSGSFACLRSTPEEARAFLAAIDPSELEKYYRGPRDAAKELDINLLELLSIALELAAGKEPPNIPIISSYDKARRIVVILPKAAPKDYDTELRDVHRARKSALQAA